MTHRDRDLEPRLYVLDDGNLCPLGPDDEHACKSYDQTMAYMLQLYVLSGFSPDMPSAWTQHHRLSIAARDSDWLWARRLLEEEREGWT